MMPNKSSPRIPRGATRKLAAIALTFTLFGCGKELTPVSGGELKALFENERSISFERLRFKGTAVLKTNGTFSVDIPALGSDNGKWWLDGRKVCSRWEKVLNGKELCVTIAQASDGTYRGLEPESDSVLGTFRFLDEAVGTERR